MALDSRHEPVLITTWYGAPSCEVIDAYYAWSDAHAAAAMAAEQQRVHIADMRHARLPTPLVRKRVAEHAVADLALELRIASIVVSGDPQLVGFVRVAGRAAPTREQPRMIAVERIDEAIESARALLRAARIPPPLGLIPGRYRPPAIHQTR